MADESPPAPPSPLELLTAWGEMGTQPGQFHSPVGLAINDASEIYTTEFHNNRVQRFTSEGKVLQEFATAPMPGGVAVDRAGNVFVAPMMSHKICVYGPDGKLLREWGSQGKEPGQFDQPGGMAIAPDATLYVADQVNRRVQQFTLEGKFIRQWGEYGKKPGQFDGVENLPNRTGGPNFVAIDPEGHVYTTEAALGRIQKFTAAGQPLLAFGDNGTQPGGFGGRPKNLPGPIGIAIDKQGRIWVSSTNNRVQRFSPEGRFLDGALELEGASEPGRFRLPHAMVIDREGHLYVADSVNQRIQKFAVREPA